MFFFCSTGAAIPAQYPPFEIPYDKAYHCPLCGELIPRGKKSQHDKESQTHMNFLSAMRDKQLARALPDIQYITFDDFV